MPTMSHNLKSLFDMTIESSATEFSPPVEANVLSPTSVVSPAWEKVWPWTSTRRSSSEWSGDSDNDFEAEYQDMEKNIGQGVVDGKWTEAQAEMAMSHNDPKARIAALVHEVSVEYIECFPSNCVAEIFENSSALDRSKGVEYNTPQCRPYDNQLRAQGDY